MNPYVILRRADLDCRDAAIVAAVARAWARGWPITYRELAKAMGLSCGEVLYRRINGRSSGSWRYRRGGGLIECGWLAKGPEYVRRTLRPGKRFAGLEAGWPLELVP